MLPIKQALTKAPLAPLVRKSLDQVFWIEVKSMMMTLRQKQFPSLLSFLPASALNVHGGTKIILLTKDPNLSLSKFPLLNKCGEVTFL